ncbi:MAG: hypothetical protein K2K14_01250 [Ruminococcus sp.]|nr:hypothetical protein [Ruminococcus sp.]
MQEFKLKIMERKVLAERLGALTGLRPQFMRGRDHSYKIGDYSVTRDGIFIAPDDADEELLQTLFNEELIEMPTQEIEPVPQEIDENNCEENTVSEESVSEYAVEPVLTLPLIDHTGLSLRNLVHLFYTRASLIEKSIGAHFYVSDAVIDALKDDTCTYSVGNFLRTVSAFSSDLQGLYFTDDSIFITASPKNTDSSHMTAFQNLIFLMNRSAIEHKRILAKKVNEENEKFAMRIWLDSIGLRGELYKQSRRILTKPLHGITAFKTQEQLDIAVEKFRKERLHA